MTTYKHEDLVTYLKASKARKIYTEHPAVGGREIWLARDGKPRYIAVWPLREGCNNVVETKIK